MADINKISVEDKLRWMKTQLDMISRTLMSIQSQMKNNKKNDESESSESSDSALSSDSDSSSSSESESYNSYDSDNKNYYSDSDQETAVNIISNNGTTYVMVELEEL